MSSFHEYIQTITTKFCKSSTTEIWTTKMSAPNPVLHPVFLGNGLKPGWETVILNYAKGQKYCHYWVILLCLVYIWKIILIDI